MRAEFFVQILPWITVLFGFVTALVQWKSAQKNPKDSVAHEPPVAIFFRTIIYSVVVATLIMATTISMKLDRTQRVLDETSAGLDEIDLLKVFGQLLKATERANASSPFLGNLLLDRQRGFQRLVREAEAGRIYVREEELGSVTSAMMESGTRSIKATSYVTPDAWWGTAWGRRYMADNKMAVKRGVRVERTFIFADEEEMSRWDHVLKENIEAGVIVRYEFSSRLSQPFTKDVISVDNIFVGVLELDGRSVNRVYFSSNQEDIRIVNDTLRVAEFAVPYQSFKNEGK